MYLQLYDQNFTHVQFLIPCTLSAVGISKYVSGWHAFIYPRSYQHIAFKTQFKASRVSNLRMINVHNFPHKCSKSCSTLFWDSKSSLWIHLLSVDTSPKCYCLQHQYCIHHPQCHLYLKSLVQKKQQPVMRLFYNVLINYLDFFCFSKLPMIKITFNINYLNFFCFPNFSRLLSTTFTFFCYD